MHTAAAGAQQPGAMGMKSGGAFLKDSCTLRDALADLRKDQLCVDVFVQVFIVHAVHKGSCSFTSSCTGISVYMSHWRMWVALHTAYACLAVNIFAIPVLIYKCRECSLFSRT